MDVRYYLRIYRNALDKEKCKETVEELNNTDEWVKHVYYNPITKINITINGDNELDNSFYNSKHKQHYMDATWNAYKMYLEELQMPWFTSWSGFSEVRFNRYIKDSVMSEHCDHIQSIFDGERKGIPFMTALGILNDDFTGGDLVFWQDQKLDVVAGDIIIFPSNYLYPHKVLPLINGKRYSFVSWAY